MKAYLEIELFGEDERQFCRLWKDAGDAIIPGLGTALIGSDPPSGWVAEITGYNQKYKYARKFLKCRKDYSRANSKGSRGIFAEYILESGKIYEIKRQISWKNAERFFCIVDNDGNIRRIDEGKVKEMLGDPPSAPIAVHNDEKNASNNSKIKKYYAALNMTIEGEPTEEQKAFLRDIMRPELMKAIKCFEMLKARINLNDLKKMLESGRFIYSVDNNMHYSLWLDFTNALSLYNYCAEIIGAKRLELNRLAREV